MPRKKRKIFSDYSNLTIFVVVLLVATLGVATWLFASLSEEVSQHVALENLDNQACRGLSIAAASGFDISTRGLYSTSKLLNSNNDNATANQKCLIYGSTQDDNIQGKKINGYSFGADVTYFDSKESAEKYAKNKVNPLRYWSPDATYTSYTFIVTHREQKYFDAYSTKNNALMRISLPCNSTNDENKDIDNCYLQADRTIALFNKNLASFNL